MNAFKGCPIWETISSTIHADFSAGENSFELLYFQPGNMADMRTFR